MDPEVELAEQLKTFDLLRDRLSSQAFNYLRDRHPSLAKILSETFADDMKCRMWLISSVPSLCNQRPIEVLLAGDSHLVRDAILSIAYGHSA